MQAIINLLPKQSDAWKCLFDDPDITEVGYGGAAGGGKTVLGSYFAIVASEEHPGSRGVIGRKELKNLKRTTMATLFTVLSELGYKQGRDYLYNEQSATMTFSNKSEIIFMDMSHSAQDPEYTRFGGLEITWAWIDESNEVPEKAKSILKTRVGRKNIFEGVTVKNKWLETFNPNKGHVYNDYFKPWKDGALPNYRAFIRALPGDNPHLPKAYLDNLARADKITKERLLFGNFDYDDDPTTMITQDAIYDLWTNTIQKNDKRYLTADIARYGADKTVIGVWQGLELIKVETYEKMGMDEIAQSIKSLMTQYQIPYSQAIADEDGVGGGVVDILRGIKGFMGASSPLELWNSMTGRMTPANFKNLRHQCYFVLADTVNSHQMRISDDTYKVQICEELAILKRRAEIVEGKLEIISKDDMKLLLGRSPDYMDMIMMRMYFMLRQKSDTIKPTGFSNRQFRINRVNINQSK